MKRLLLILLVLFLFSGCSDKAIQETSDPSTEPTETEATSPGLYIPDSIVEQHTGGAVRAYGLDSNEYSWVMPMRDKVLLLSANDPKEMIVLAGDTGRVLASVPIVGDITETDFCWQITATGFAYYSKAENSVIYMDSNLHRIDSVLLPDGIHGRVLIDPKNNNIYYCSEDEIRAMDSDTNISRLVRKNPGENLELTGIYFNGTVLSCQSTALNGDERFVYISSQTGESLSTDSNIISLTTQDTRYFAVRKDGVIRQHIFGERDASAQCLNISGELTAVLSMNGIVRHTLTDSGLEFYFYDLISGKQTAGVTVPGVTNVIALAAGETELWALACEGAEQRIYRWDIQKSPVTDDVVYTGPLYTAAAPDEAGLQACQQRVDDLNKTHGLAIRIWQDAVKSAGGYVLEAEYQTEAINKVLDELEPVLALFPENFLYKSVNTRVRICVVRSISGEMTGAHYWLNDDYFIILSSGVNVYDELLKATGYVISTNVMGNSPILDEWASLNPEGFTYGSAEGLEDYLEGENMAFADADSMQSITEDRSRLFWYAMKADNAKMFQSPAMQGKLALLCKGIRDAWRLEKKTDVYPWEQYLHESIAYVKK